MRAASRALLLASSTQRTAYRCAPLRWGSASFRSAQVRPPTTLAHCVRSELCPEASRRWYCDAASGQEVEDADTAPEEKQSERVTIEISADAALLRSQQLVQQGKALLEDGRPVNASMRLKAGVDLMEMANAIPSEVWRAGAAAAAAMHDAGDVNGAERYYRKALEVARGEQEEGRGYARLLLNMSNLLAQQDKLDEAEEVCTEAIELLKKSDSNHYGLALLNLVAVECARASSAGDGGEHITKAKELVEEAHDALCRAYGSTSAYVEASIRQRAQILRLENDEAAAEAVEQEWEQRSKRAPEPEVEGREISRERAEQLLGEWKELPLGTCDPRGMLLPKHALQEEVSTFIQAWKDAGLPLDETMSSALRSDLNLIEEARE